MIAASCHCGAVRYTVEQAPEWVMDCNCSHCRLYGPLWAYYPQRDVKFETPPDTFVYMWGDRMLEMHHCKTCGCFSHFTIVGDADAEKIGVNARLMGGLHPAQVPVVQKNNGNDHVFWTKSDRPVLPSHDEPS
ncbi:hypothetical protein U91I_00814 [alpha proteobacterium U9-1i]|nr:hypothetical protein U91I_00814 [alpha proteobacterium U9-1i]